MSQTKTLLFIAPQESAFVRKDLELLRSQYEVIAAPMNWTDNGRIGIRLIQQFFFLLKNTPKSVAIMVYFGGYWSFLPAVIGKLFGKKTFIVLAGADAVSFPSIDYGSFRKPLMAWFLRNSYRLADHLFPVSQSLVLSDYSFYPADGNQQGYLAHAPKVKTPYTVSPFGFEFDFWSPSAHTRTPNSFITVAVLSQQNRIPLKGVDLMLEAARQLPDFTFTVIGALPHKQLLKPEELPANFNLIPVSDREMIRHQFHKHEFYLQVSISEGFPNALGEAMLCGCIPIGSQVSAIPEMIGDTGLLLSERNAAMFVDLLKTATELSDKETRSENARNRILGSFSQERRLDSFVRYIEG